MAVNNERLTRSLPLTRLPAFPSMSPLPNPPHASTPVGMTKSGHSFCFDCLQTRRILYIMNPTARDGVDELLQNYSETGGINYLDAAATLPSRLAIEASCAELMSLMFPGFRSEALVSSEDLAETTRARIRNLHARLKTEICRSLGKIPPNEAIEAKADEVL